MLTIAWGRGQDDEWLRRTLSAPGRWRKELSALIEDVDNSAFRDQLRRLRRDAKAVLDDRHRIVHSVATLEQAEDGQSVWSFWHPRSDTDADQRQSDP